MKSEIRPMVETDLTAVLQIEQVAKPTPWNRAMYEQEFTNAHSNQQVLCVDGRIVGYIVWWLVVDEIQIQTIVVDSSYRGQRFGQKLLHHALQHGFENGAQLSVLEVRESNTAAQNLYHKFGYEVAGRRKNYYRDGETALLMTSDFTAVPPSFAERLNTIANEL